MVTPAVPSYATNKHRRLHYRGTAGSPLSSASASASSSPPCDHPPSATLGLIVPALVLLSCAFLVASSFSHIITSLSLVLPPLLSPVISSLSDSPLPYVAGLALFFVATVSLALALEVGGGLWSSRRCQNPRCKGLRDAVEFDVQVQTEEGARAPDAKWREIDELPWKGGGNGDNPDYECVRKELKRMAPPNGRAVLRFRAPCGCPLSKLEGWGPKKGRKHKKTVSTSS